MTDPAKTFHLSSSESPINDKCNVNFDDLVLYIKNRNDGTTAWDALNVAGTITLAGTWDGWIGANETWTYASATTFTISGDLTGKYQKGDKIKLTQTTAKYFYIVTVAHAGGTTTVTVTGGADYTLANAAITSPYYSKAANPQGFPTFFTWTAGFTGFSSNPTSVISIFWITGNICSVWHEEGASGTSNAVTFTVTGLPVAVATIFGDATVRSQARVQDNGTAANGNVGLSSTTATIYASATAAANAWTNSGNKRCFAFKVDYPF